MLLAEYVTHIFDVTTETAGRLYDVGVNESRPGDTFYLSLAFLGLSVSFIRVKTGASPQYCIFTSPGVYSWRQANERVGRSLKPAIFGRSLY